MDWDAANSISEHNLTPTVSPLEQADVSTLKNPFADDVYERDLCLWNDDYDPVLALGIPGSPQAADQISFGQEPTAGLEQISTRSGLEEPQVPLSMPGIGARPQPPVFSLPEPPTIVDQL